MKTSLHLGCVRQEHDPEGEAVVPPRVHLDPALGHGPHDATVHVPELTDQQTNGGQPVEASRTTNDVAHVVPAPGPTTADEVVELDVHAALETKVQAGHERVQKSGVHPMPSNPRDSDTHSLEGA